MNPLFDENVKLHDLFIDVIQSIAKQSIKSGIENIKDFKYFYKFKKEDKVSCWINFYRKLPDLILSNGIAIECITGTIRKNNKITGNISIDKEKFVFINGLSKDLKKNLYFIFLPTDLIENKKLSNDSSFNDVKEVFDTILILNSIDLESSITYANNEYVLSQISGYWYAREALESILNNIELSEKELITKDKNSKKKFVEFVKNKNIL